MGKKKQLITLGTNLIQLSQVLYGSCSSPISKADQLAAKTGIKPDLIQAALIAAGSR